MSCPDCRVSVEKSLEFFGTFEPETEEHTLKTGLIKVELVYSVLNVFAANDIMEFYWKLGLASNTKMRKHLHSRVVCYLVGFCPTFSTGW